jgi:hypothetical protein
MIILYYIHLLDLTSLYLWWSPICDTSTQHNYLILYWMAGCKLHVWDPYQL